MATPAIQTLLSDAQQVLNLNSLSEVRSTMAAALANANVGTPLNPNLTTQQLWDEFYLIVRQPESDIESIITNQLMKFLYAPPAPNGVAGNKRVIFNDNGVLATDKDFTYDKATDTLYVDGTATLASATITGDLTVRTNRLATTTTGVGIGTASPSYDLQVNGSTNGRIQVEGASGFGMVFIQASSGNSAQLQLNSSGGSGRRFAVNSNSSGQLTISDETAASTRFAIDSTGVFTFQNVGGFAGTAMTLNSTGLGVGGSPASKLYAYGSNVSTIGQFRIDCPAAGTAQQTFAINGTYQGQLFTDGTKFVIGTPNSTSIVFRTNLTEALTIDASQNVGVGVTPSAWRNTQRALQIGAVGTYFSSAASAGSTCIGRNVYESAAGNFTYIVNDEATLYEQSATGQHAWYTAAANTGTIAFTQAMTLDASGNLLVAKSTAGSLGTVGHELKANGEVFATQSSSNNVATTFHAYSSGAAAYRFYVGMGGTVYATNTTISAISDARLKENVQDIDVGLGAILALKPRKFDWKEGKGKNIKGDRGFIAQEFEQVFPNLIDEWKDNAPEGETPYKSVRQDLIPVLVKAIQELTARVAALEA